MRLPRVAFAAVTSWDGGMTPQSTEGADNEGTTGPADEDVAGAQASPPGEDLDRYPAFVVDALAGHLVPRARVIWRDRWISRLSGRRTVACSTVFSKTIS